MLAPPWLLLGGGGLFLFGIRHFSESLQKTAGPRFKNFLERSNANRFLSLLFGAILTIVFHSETIASILAITLTNSGLLTLYQVTAVLVGTSVGALFAVQTGMFRSIELAMCLMFAGVVAKFFFRSRKVALWGDLVFGAGVIFTSLAFIEQGFFGIVQSSLVASIVPQISKYPMVPIILGALFVIFLQSGQSALLLSSALMGSHLLDRHDAFYIIAGSFLGAPLMALTASLPGTSTARHAASVFCIMAGVVAGTVAAAEPLLASWLEHRFPGDFHYLVSLQAIISILLGSAALLSVGYVTRFIVSRRDRTVDVDANVRFLDFRIISTPGLAIHQLEGELSRMAAMTGEMIVHLESLLYRFDNRVSTRLLMQERALDHLQHEISRFATNLAPLLVDSEMRERLPQIFTVTNTLEQIGDKVVRFLQVLLRKKEERLHFSHVAMNDLKMIIAEVRSFMESVISAWGESGTLSIEKCEQARLGISHMLRDANESHLERLAAGKCTVRGGMLFSELLEIVAGINDNLIALCRSRHSGWSHEEKRGD